MSTWVWNHPKNKDYFWLLNRIVNEKKSISSIKRSHPNSVHEITIKISSGFIVSKYTSNEIPVNNKMSMHTFDRRWYHLTTIIHAAQGTSPSHSNQVHWSIWTLQSWKIGVSIFTQWNPETKWHDTRVWLCVGRTTVVVSQWGRSERGGGIVAPTTKSS